jgi:hypothetical protein
VVLRDFAQQQLQELRRSPIEHDASLWTPRWADGADLGPIGLNVVGEPVEPLFSNVGARCCVCIACFSFLVEVLDTLLMRRLAAAGARAKPAEPGRAHFARRTLAAGTASAAPRDDLHAPCPVL